MIKIFTKPILFLFYNIFIANIIKSSYSYDINVAETAVWLSGAAYCGKDNYTSMKLAGPASNFIVENVLYDKKTDLEGYTGVLISTNSIYVVFRGSFSDRNWIDDFEILKTKYHTFSECDCKVHRGFYQATLNLKNSTINSVNFLKKKYGYSNVIVTGHSLGAAIAQMMGMELVAVNISNIIYNYGQPRVGDKDYARFVNSILEQQLKLYRFTHDKDIIPHVPPLDIGYVHSCREIFENINGTLKNCSLENCEDQTCANQFPLIDTNIKEHMYYLKHYLGCKSSTVHV